MKKLIFLLLLVGMMLPATTFAQAPIDLKVNPLGLLFNNPDVSAEFNLSESFGLEPIIGLSYGGLDVGNIRYSNRGVRAGVLGKFYFNPDDGCDKFYAGLYSRFGSTGLTATDPNTNNELNVSNVRLGLGVLIGYKWVSNGGFIFELGVGGGRNFVNNFTSDNQTIDLAAFPLANIDVIAILAIGYRLNR